MFKAREHTKDRMAESDFRSLTQISPEGVAQAALNRRARVRKWKQNEQKPRTCFIRRGIARFVFSFLRARVPSVSNARGPYVQRAWPGSRPNGARTQGTPFPVPAFLVILGSARRHRNLVPPWSTFGQKIFFAEKTMSLESSRARGPQEFFCSGKLAPKTAQTRVLKTGVCTGSRPAGAATRNPQLEWVCPIRVFGGKMVPKRGQKARTEAAEATAHECACARTGS